MVHIWYKCGIVLYLIFICIYMFLKFSLNIFIEHLNILLFGLAQRLHKALSKVDISFYSSNGDKRKNVENNVPSCHHHHPAKLVMVKKEGPNKVLFPLPLLLLYLPNTYPTKGLGIIDKSLEREICKRKFYIIL